MNKQLLILFISVISYMVNAQDDCDNYCVYNEEIVLNAHYGVKFYYKIYPGRKSKNGLQSWMVVVYLENTNDFTVKRLYGRTNDVTITGLYRTNDYPFEVSKEVSFNVSPLAPHSVYSEIFYLKSDDPPNVALNSLTFGLFGKAEF